MTAINPLEVMSVAGSQYDDAEARFITLRARQENLGPIRGLVNRGLTELARAEAAAAFNAYESAAEEWQRTGEHTVIPPTA